MSEQRGTRRPFWYLRRRPETVASDVDEELSLHVEMRAEELQARGVPRDAARRAALDQFGDLEYTRRYCLQQGLVKEKRMSRGLLLADLIQELRIACRSLLRAPVMTMTIVATVGLGIGATTVIFGAIDAALLRSLPYADPGRLVRIYTDSPPNKFPFSVADYLALNAQQTQFARIAGYTNQPMAFTDGRAADRVPGKVVTWSYFSLLGVVPVMGRDFVESDGGPDQLVVIVSHRFWRDRLGGTSNAVGKPIRINGRDRIVVGVLPPPTGPLEERQDLFVATQYEPPSRKGPFLITVLGRLRASSKPPAAADELRALNRRMFPIWKASYQDDRATWAMMDLKTHVVGDVGTIAGVALAAVALVWLVACANASSLLIARVTSRRRELAVRAALGASRGRIVRYVLAESALLAVAATAVGVGLAWVGIGLLRDFGSAYFPRTQEIAIDGPVLWLLAALAAASVALFGLIPAVHGSGGSLDDSLRSSGRSSTGTVAVRRLRRVLVGSQFAIATPLLVVAGLLLVSLNELGRVDLGFDTHNQLTGSIVLPPAQYPEPARVAAFWDQLQRRVGSLPGVVGVATADGRPPNDVNNINNFDLEDAPTPSGQSQPIAPWISVTPEYFRLLGLNLLQGRLLDARDGLTTTVESVVVDRAWAARFFPHGDAVGRRLKEGGCTQCPWTTVIGVVSDVKYMGLDKPDRGTVYAAMPPQGRFRYLMLRTSADPASLIPAVRQVVRELDPSLPFSDVATIDELVVQSLQRPRSLSLLIASLALVALALSIVGIYGVMAFYVQQHKKDISIRIALGGRSGEVLRLIVGQGMKAVVAGVAIGLIIALGAARLMSSLLFGVGAADPLTLAAAAGLMLAIAILACVVPARRAVGLEPALVLRDE